MVGAEVLELRFANARLLASRQPLDIRGMADIEKDGEQQEQYGEPPLAGESERANARYACSKRRYVYVLAQFCFGNYSRVEVGRPLK